MRPFNYLTLIGEIKMSKNAVLGIDLGTSTSCVAIFENGAYKVIENSEGTRTTPSIVTYTDDEILVGASAKRQAVTNPKNTIYEVKRLIGRKFKDKEVQKDIKLVPYDIIEADNGDAWVKVNEQKLAPPQVSAEILRKMKKTAEEYLGYEVNRAVITVPAYFNDSQRQATKDAGTIAGLEVLRIINEPTAAALAFGVDKISKTDIKVAVFDTGGGTHDISIIEIADVNGEKQIEVLSTNGDSFLGGSDVYNALIDYLVDEFKKETSVDLKTDKMALQRLKDAAEKAKIELSSSSQTEVNLPYITADATGPKHLNVKVTKAKFESLIDGFISKLIEPCKIALKDAGLTVSDIDDVILVGGSTRIPKVQEVVEKFFGKAPRKDINPDEAVAAGAAIQGAVLSGDKNDVLLLDVTPLSLGIETMGGVMNKIIQKNTTIPTASSQTYSTADDNQPAVTIKVYQGERELVQYNNLLGEFNLEGIEPARRGEPKINVKFDIDANGILHVSAKDEKSGKENKITIKSSSGLSDADIQRMVKDAEENAEADKKIRELIETRNGVDTQLHNIKKEITDLGDVLLEDEKSDINSKIAEIEESLKSDDIDVIKGLQEKLIPIIGQVAAIKEKQNPEVKPNSPPDDQPIDASFTKE
jgi:molecular chaperone DnaK